MLVEGARYEDVAGYNKRNPKKGIEIAPFDVGEALALEAMLQQKKSQKGN
jgi:hypothetical protein